MGPSLTPSEVNTYWSVKFMGLVWVFFHTCFFYVKIKFSKIKKLEIFEQYYVSNNIFVKKKLGLIRQPKQDLPA